MIIHCVESGKVDSPVRDSSTGKALNAALDEKLMHADKQARLPRDPELLNRLTLATAEIQRVRDEHTAEVAGVRKECERHLQCHYSGSSVSAPGSLRRDVLSTTLIGLLGIPVLAVSAYQTEENGTSNLDRTDKHTVKDSWALNFKECDFTRRI